MVRPQHLRVIPDDLTETPLHRPHAASFDPQRDGFDRFAFQGTELAHHIAKEMFPRLAPGKTIVEGVMKPPQFVEQAFDVTVVHGKLGDGKLLTFRPPGWYHPLPPYG